jgi:Ca-activated chloride channel family protein
MCQGINFALPQKTYLLRPALLILVLHVLPIALPAQYYLTGEVVDYHGDKLQNVGITVLSTGLTFHSGLHGEFGIISRTMDDTLTFAVDGYESFTIPAHSTQITQVTLKTVPFSTAIGQDRQLSLFRGVHPRDGSGGVRAASIAYSSRIENPFVPQSATVSFIGAPHLSSYHTIRRFLDMGSIVPPDAVKIEEMLNYFNFSYEEPDKWDAFHCSSQLVTCPWNHEHQLLFLNVCARKADLDNKPPANLVLLIDASGSMDLPDKLPLVKTGIRTLVDNLRDIDVLSVVEYGADVKVLLAGVPGSQKGKIMTAIERLKPDGPSPGLEGIQMAYSVAQRQFIPGGNNKVVLITDGNISEVSGQEGEKNLEDFIAQESQAGIHLSCGGIGMANFNDSRLPLLAALGRGNFAYLDNEEDVRQLLAGELDSSLTCVADKMSITVDFDSTLVKEYRLIGFDNKRGIPQDTVSGLEGSRICSGHSLLALFELAPKVDSIRDDTLAGVKISYCLPGQHVQQVISYPCPNQLIPFERSALSLRRAACIALFGMKLQQSGYAGPMEWAEIEKMARKIFTGTNYLDDDYIALIDKARKIYERRR